MKTAWMISVGAAASAVFVGYVNAAPAVKLPDTILYGVAYYDEYTPVDRTTQDAAMMKAAGITVVRIAESTWGTMEPREGVFDFSHIDRTLDAMHKAGIKVIVGTPTYAIPTWLARAHPDVLAVTPKGRNEYGPRQNMDITNPAYRQAAERAIVALVDHVKAHPAVIGYQLDNETKSYGTSGPNVQAAFVASMKKTFPKLDDLNAVFGLDYWSNRINSWDDFPSVNASINASLTNAFKAFQRNLVTDFLGWQASLVRAHARPDQFLTQNFDLGWRDGSFGVQSEVDHWAAGRVLDVAGIDIYHPSQDKLTGADIAFGGDLARSIRDGQNYLVLETEAQGFPQWTPYPGQLRLQAFSHLASGANMIEYWHWASTANAIETYWRGLLSQDYRPNATYDEAKTIGADFKRLGPKLVNMKKSNRVAIYVSNTALSAFDAFKIDTPDGPRYYNDVVRGFYDALYRQNIEADLISPGSAVDLSTYDLIVVPSLYAASDTEIRRLNEYAKRGGHLVYSFKSGFSDEHSKVRYAAQPGAIAEAAGVEYSQFTLPEDVSLKDDPYGAGPENKALWWMEFLKPTTATVVARYQHAAWPDYAAMTRNAYGKGTVTYIGFMPSNDLLEKIIMDEAHRAGVAPATANRFPIIVRSGTLSNGHRIRYVLNYSGQAQTPIYDLETGTDLLSGKAVRKGASLPLPAWGFRVIEEQ